MKILRTVYLFLLTICIGGITLAQNPTTTRLRAVKVVVESGGNVSVSIVTNHFHLMTDFGGANGDRQVVTGRHYSTVLDGYWSVGNGTEKNLSIQDRDVQKIWVKVARNGSSIPILSSSGTLTIIGTPKFGNTGNQEYPRIIKNATECFSPSRPGNSQYGEVKVAKFIVDDVAKLEEGGSLRYSEISFSPDADAILLVIKEDGASALSLAYPQMQIRQLYKDILEREPDGEGLMTWTNAMKGGWSLSKVRDGIAKSEEAKSKVNDLYRTLLCRTAEAAGLVTWTNAMSGGMSLKQVASEIRNSPEYRSRGNAPCR